MVYGGGRVALMPHATMCTTMTHTHQQNHSNHLVNQTKSDFVYSLIHLRKHSAPSVNQTKSGFVHSPLYCRKQWPMNGSGNSEFVYSLP